MQHSIIMLEAELEANFLRMEKTMGGDLETQALKHSIIERVNDMFGVNASAYVVNTTEYASIELALQANPDAQSLIDQLVTSMY